jgi:uncharacterized Tic20 family protein
MIEDADKKRNELKTKREWIEYYLIFVGLVAIAMIIGFLVIVVGLVIYAATKNLIDLILVVLCLVFILIYLWIISKLEIKGM